MSTPLAGMTILVLEDEYLIAMDVEQLCRDHGADDVVIMRSMEEVAGRSDVDDNVHVAVLDVMLGGNPTMDFAHRLKEKGVPFIFATGYSDNESLFQPFPGVKVVAKPYGGANLIEAITAAIGNGEAAPASTSSAQ